MQKRINLDDLFSMQEKMSRILSARQEETLAAARNQDGWSPTADVYDCDHEFVILVDLPGVAPGDFQVEMEENVLVLRGESRPPSPEKIHGEVIRQERRYGPFQRSFTLPGTVVADQISARLHEGVLEIVVPRHPQALPRRIDVQEES